jgi:hypothetical protein
MMIDFDADAEPIRGVISEGSESVPFSGYLGLVSAISSALEAEAPHGTSVAGGGERAGDAEAR